MALEVYDQGMADAIRNDDWDLAARLGQIADKLVPETRVDVLTAALWYASLGLRVFPLRPNSKIPFPGSRGCYDGTADAERIRAWWTKAPQANLAIATGHLVDVIDLDGLPGIMSFPDLEGVPQIIGRARTVRPGGWHYYVPASGIGNRAHILPGIDIRGDGGYVVAPPSVIGGRLYRWIQPLTLGR